MKLVAIALFLLMSAAFAATPVEMLEQLRGELRTELRSALDKGNGENNQRLFQIESLLVEQLPAGEMPEEQFTQIIQILGQIRSLTRVAKTEEHCEDLILELRMLAAARDKKFRETFGSTIKESLLTGLKAKTPKEVDAPLLALATLQKQINQMERYNSSGRGVDTQQLPTATSILTLWQDAMLPRAGAQRGRNGIEQLEGMAQNYAQQLGDLLPRSEFIALLHDARARLDPALTRKPLTSAEVNRQSAEILRNVKRLEDLADAQKAMQAISADSEGSTSNSSAAAQALGRLHRFYEDMKAGAALSFATLDRTSTGSEAEETAALRELLIKMALPRVLRVTGEATPREDENVTAYLGRMIEESQKKSDWPLLSRVLDAAQSLKLTGLVATNDSNALRMLLAAVNQERARIYSGAVAYYLAALKSGSQTVPSELIGEKLEAIRKDHPQDYEAGKDIPVPDPATQRTVGYPYPMGLSQRFNVGPTPPPAPLVVPAVPKATTTAKDAPVPAPEKKPAETEKPESTNKNAKP